MVSELAAAFNHMHYLEADQASQRPETRPVPAECSAVSRQGKWKLEVEAETETLINFNSNPRCACGFWSRPS